MALPSNALASYTVCRCRDDYGSGAGMGFDGGLGMSTPRLPEIPTELYEFYPAMSAGNHAALVKEYALSAMAKTIQAAKLEAYQEAAKVAEERFTEQSVPKNAKGRPYASGNVAIYAAKEIGRVIRELEK